MTNNRIERIAALMLQLETMIRESLGADVKYFDGVYLHQYPGKWVPDKYFLTITMFDGSKDSCSEVTASLERIESILILWFKKYAEDPWVVIPDRYRKEGYYERYPECKIGWNTSVIILGPMVEVEG